MKNWYFYQEQGHTKGPLTVDDLRARIRSGRLRLFDLIYKEGEAGWRMALEHPDLREEFKDFGSGHSKERPWVCLHRKNEQSFDFITLGPFSEDEVRESIRSGKLSYADFIWRADFSEWRRIGGLEEFNPRVRQPEPEREEPTVSELLSNVVQMKRGGQDEATVIMRPLEPVGRDLTKPPPLKSDDLDDDADGDAPTRVVHRGDEATRIVTRPLDPEATRIVRPRASDMPPPLPASTGTEPRVFRRSAPGETRSRELDDGSSTQTRQRRERNRWLRFSTDWAIVGGLILTLVLVIALISKRMRNSTPEPVPYSQIEELEPGHSQLSPPDDAGPGVATLPPVAAEVPPPLPVESAPLPREVAPPVETMEKPKAVSRAPTQLVLNVQAASASNARIEVRSNGTPDHPVFVQIVGLPGQVSEGASFYRYLKLKPSGNPGQPLDLGDIRLPQGRFVLRAETGKLEKQANLNLGVAETQFKQAVARERKAHSAAIWQERARLFKLSQTLEAALEQAATGKKKFSGSGLEPLNAVKKSNGGSYILFDDWWEGREILQEARVQATPALIERARKLKERMASFSVWRIK
ncbi:MAG: DUF4339 domain-containing protein [Bdellovibrionales bacterium]|nr:DUF4339 domain-containing protein [Bdellovibrionales bacterium]